MLIFLLIKICVSIYLEKFNRPDILDTIWTLNCQIPILIEIIELRGQASIAVLNMYYLQSVCTPQTQLLPSKLNWFKKKLNNKTKEVDVNNIFQSLCIMNNNKSDAWHNHRVCALATEQLQFITPWSTNNVVYCFYVFFFIY